MPFSSSDDLNTISLHISSKEKIHKLFICGIFPLCLSFRISYSLRKIFNSLYSATRRNESRLSVLRK